MATEMRVVGHGPIQVMFLHGWLTDHSVFDPLIPYFNEADYTLAFMDYRGYGMSRGANGDYSIREIAGDMLTCLDRLGWDKAHVIGHSMGGMVLQQAALMAPGRVLSGTAVTPVPASGYHIDEDINRLFLSAADEDSALETMFAFLTGQQHGEGFARRARIESRAATSRAAYLGYMQAWLTTDFSKEVKALEMPVRVIAGRHDAALPPEHQTETSVAELGNAHLKVLEAAGHYPSWETPVELFTLIDEFLRSL